MWIGYSRSIFPCPERNGIAALWRKLATGMMAVSLAPIAAQWNAFGAIAYPMLSSLSRGFLVNACGGLTPPPHPEPPTRPMRLDALRVPPNP